MGIPEEGEDTMEACRFKHAVPKSSMKDSDDMHLAAAMSQPVCIGRVKDCTVSCLGVVSCDIATQMHGFPKGF